MIGQPEDCKTLLSVVIPCYNENATIGSVVLATKQYVDEVLVIDDGSVDDTSEIAQLAGATVIAHKTNRGKSTGIKTGFKYALDKDFDWQPEEAMKCHGCNSTEKKAI